ncbi:hypothetical protein SFUMM280S_11481 [Streptomyces fumanus]
MTALNRVPSLMARAGTASALTIAAVGGSIAVPGLASEAAAATPATKALKIAASKKGAPYRYGATGPSRFDCSGLTLYSFKKAGKKLPRTAAQQYNKTRHISAGSRKAGTWCSSTRAGASTTWASTPVRARSGTPRRRGRGAPAEDLDQERLVRPGQVDPDGPVHRPGTPAYGPAGGRSGA